MALLRVENLSKYYPVSNGIFGRTNMNKANQNISLKLDAGKTLAIVGESGSGKTTLARQIIGIEKPTKGSIWLDEHKINFDNRRDRKKRFKKIRMIFQNPYDSLNPQVRVGHSLEQTLIINTKLSGKQRRKKIEETLLKVGLQQEHQYRYPHMFSGGQRQRIAIARAIILEPSIIIADEPLSALDVSIQAQILNLLQSLQEDMGISFIFISHDLNVVEHISDTVMIMYHGQVVEYGNVSQIFDEPLHPYTQALFASTPLYRSRFPQFLSQSVVARSSTSLSGCVFANRCQYCEHKCRSNRPALVNADQDYQIACFRFE